MAKTWITADWHLGESRLDLLLRPFSDTMAMGDALIGNHNALVSDDDTVIVAGDVCYQKAPEFLNFVARFKGKKILLRGNHDRVFTDEQLKPYFERIIPEGLGIELEVEGIPCYATHYPTRGRADRFNLVGHIHAAWKYQLNTFNIGVDTNH
jgi:calcineurin-like phosphoesterase family protein